MTGGSGVHWSVVHVPFYSSYEDQVVEAAKVSFTVYTAKNQVLVHYGLGRHVILVTNPKAFAIVSRRPTTTHCWLFADGALTLQTAILGAVTYVTTLGAIKFSILYFYARLFPQRWFKLALIGTGAFTGALSIAQIPVDVVQCVPIQSQWDPEVKGKCVHFGTFILAAGIANIATDVILLILPMPILWQLQVSASRKRILLLVFVIAGG